MTTVKISERALLQRLNRHLEKEEGQIIRKCRENARGYHNLGDYYLLDIRTNTVVNTHLDLEQMGRDLKVLSKHETLEG